MEKIVLWDFDGVLADSLRECYTVTARVVEKEREVLEKIIGKEPAPYLLQEFSSDRPVCINAADFFVNYIARRKYGAVGEAQRRPILEQKQVLHKLDEKYYQTRAAYAKELKGTYAAQLPPYAEVLDTLKELKENGVRQAIMTARDRESVREWLRYYRVEDCIELIVGTEISRADRDLKGKQIHVLKEYFGKTHRTEKEQTYWFVDDIAHNLELVHRADPSIRLAFAGWGYGKRGFQSVLLDKPTQVIAALEQY